MKTNSKVKRFQKRRTINIGYVVFFIIFIYVCITVYIYATKDHLTIYEVRKGTVSEDNVYNGLILRNEKIINTNMDGYVYYYFKDGDRVSKDSIVYSIDKEQYSSSLVDDDSEGLTLSKSDTSKIKKDISNFYNNYDNNNFSFVYDFKYDLSNTVFAVTSEQKQDSLQTMENGGNKNALQFINAEDSGIISYYFDGLENITESNISQEHFNISNYSKTQLRKEEAYQLDAPVYKLITDHNWSIIIPLTKEKYEALSEVDQVKLTFLNDELQLDSNLILFQNGEEYFGKLELNKYMENYINQRYIDIELNIDTTNGLKIPNSSIVKKDFYKIPLEFFTIGGDSNDEGVILETYDDENEVIYEFVPTDIFYKDENYGYIDTRIFEDNSWIKSETDERLRIGDKDTLQGVYNVNKGYAIFRQIEILQEGEEYTIIKEGTPYGVSVYDQIALIGDTAIEQQIIY